MDQGRFPRWLQECRSSPGCVGRMGALGMSSGVRNLRELCSLEDA